jgi:WD40 repeat protein
LASSGTDGTIQIWDPQQAVPIGVPLSGHTAGVFRLAAWTWPDGQVLASAGEDGLVYLWDLDGDVPHGVPLTGHDGWVQALAFWNDAAGTPRLASAGADGTVRIWDPLTGEPLGRPLVSGRPRLVGLAAWSTVEGVRLAVADDTGNIRVWDPERRTPVGHLRMHHGGGLWMPLTAWSTSDGSSRLASGGLDGTIRIWHPESGTQVMNPLRGHSNWVPTLATWTDGDGATRIVSAGTDGTVRVWNAETGAPVGIPIRGFGGSMATLTTWTTPSGEQRLAFVGGDGAIRSCDVHTGQTIGEPLVGHVAGVWALTNWLGSDGIRLARSGDDGAIRVWNADTGQEIGRPLTGHTAGVWALVSWVATDGTVTLASTGDDGTIRVWNVASGVQVVTPITGHAGWVPGLAVWRRSDGSTALVSAGVDGTVRRWDPTAGTEIGDPLRGHAGAVMAVAAWQGRAGPRIASGGVDGTVRLWDPERGEPIGEPLTGHAGLVRALAVWHDADRTLLVSGSYDQTIRIWDGETGAALDEPFTGHHGQVATLTMWTAPDGGARLASAGSDGVVHLWNLESRTQFGVPLAGHVAGIWALTSWSDPRFGARLASAGHDGSVRLWDPELGHAVRTIEIGPVTIWGQSDAPSSRDVIGRQLLADAIADQLHPRSGEPDPGQSDGPTVVSVEGPWGSGKSTVMKLIRERLPAPAPAARSTTGRHTTVATVLGELRGYGSEPSTPGRRPRNAPTGSVTAWFNPWAYQSGEQVWAGLANEIIEAAAAVLYPTEPARERYWLARNIDRVDRYALRRFLKQRTRSPILRLAIGALVTPLAISLVRLNDPVDIVGTTVTPVLLAVGVAAVTVVAGAAHTLWRRWFGRAVDYIPADLLTGPVADGSAIGGTDERPDASADPLRRAQAGALYLHQHNIGDLIDDLAAAGYDLVVFVDDIDRCRPGTVAEVFEAINLFLSNVASRSGLRAHFVVGLDSAVVASHLDLMYGKQADAAIALHGDDPTPGWAFLRKLIQLPVLIPQVPDEGLHRLVDSMTSVADPPPVRPPPAPVARVAMTSPEQPRQRPAAQTTITESRRVPVQRAPVDTFTWKSSERHPQVRDLLIQRLSGQPYRSIREAKRLMNVWQFYARIMDVLEPLAQPDELIVRARHLIIVSEIVTRWPALQRPLHRHFDGRRGLQLLAAAVDVDDDWQRAVESLGAESPDDLRALASLRSLLQDNDGRTVADLAARLM